MISCGSDNATRLHCGIDGSGGFCRAKSGYNPKLTLQPYVWTQQFNKEKIPLAAGLDQLFPAAQRAGYRRMELLNSFLTPELREHTATLVRQYNFEIPVVYHGGTFHAMISIKVKPFLFVWNINDSVLKWIPD